MKLEAKKLIKEFYSTYVKEHYPNLSYEDTVAICKTPFILIKKTMEEGKLNSVRIRHFGIFHVPPRKIESMFANNQRLKDRILSILESNAKAEKERLEKKKVHTPLRGPRGRYNYGRPVILIDDTND